jgi:AraC-like DNA-binding protein
MVDNMIENLNAISFNKYGNIIYEGFSQGIKSIYHGDVILEEHEIKEKTAGKFLRAEDSPVTLDIVDGIAILCVSLMPSQEEIRMFLLDKAISINPGVYYCVLTLYGRCCIKSAMLEGSRLKELENSREFAPLGIYPKVEINKVHTLFYQEKEKGFIFKGEKHGFWEFTYVDRGSMYNIVDGKGYRLSQGEAMFYGSDQHHIQWSDVDLSVCFVTATFDMEFEEASLLTDKKFILDHEMRELIGKIIAESSNNSYYADDLVICYLKELIIKLVRGEKLESTIDRQETQVRFKIENSIVARCLEYIHNNISRKLSVSDIAKSIPISQSYLSIIFKKHMDMTLVDYINSFRLEKSKELIRSGEYNITQIADLLGYTSVHYFSNQFKLKYGISPRSYAKSIKS